MNEIIRDETGEWVRTDSKTDWKFAVVVEFDPEKFAAEREASIAQTQTYEKWTPEMKSRYSDRERESIEEIRREPSVVWSTHKTYSAAVQKAASSLFPSYRADVRIVEVRR